jgi:hypothetical protein
MKQTNRTSSSKPVCKFYNSSQGCLKGDACAFAHTQNVNRTSSHSKNDTELSTSEWKHMVVHCKKSKYDVYIGRPNPSIPNSSENKWGNPFKISDTMNRAQVINAYREWINDRPELVQKAKNELKGKILACWCSPKGCHGDVLAEIANT